MNCPSCQGYNSFSVTNDKGKIKYICFRNSCKLHGIYKKDLSLSDIKLIHKQEEPKPLHIEDCIGWEQNLSSNSAAMDYIVRNNCFEAYKKWPERFFYDRIQDRIVFVSYETRNSFNIAVGRCLHKSKQKWFKYVSLPFTMFSFPSAKHNTDNDVCFICEDTASCASLCRFGIGIALCGTVYNIHSLIQVIKGKEVYICLDADAIETSLKLKRDLEGIGKFDKVKVLRLSDDAKYLKYEQIEKELQNGKETRN